MEVNSSYIEVEIEGVGKRRIAVGTTLEELAKDCWPDTWRNVLAAYVDNDLRELTQIITQDCAISFFGLENRDGYRIYQRSVTFILIRAARETLPECRVTIEHSLSNGLYGEIHFERALMEKDLRDIERRMQEIIARDEALEKFVMPKGAARELFLKDNQLDKVNLLKFREADTINVYRSGWLYDYFYGYMVPSTGYLSKFRLRFYLPGFILQIPDPQNPDVIPPYREQPQLASVHREAEHWGNILNVGTVSALNDIIAGGGSGDLIRIAEALHEKKIAQMADMILKRHATLRIILIAGPSSSGKTTFAQRLSIQLRVNGLHPVAIHLDDYFLDRENTPRDEHDEYDFESIEAIDLELFNTHLSELIQGEEVEIPSFNFITGKREYTGKTLRVAPGEPIIIEGIHGLNDRLTQSIPSGNKFKIYISALTQLNIDDHNRIPTTDVRLLRRMVRDYQFRSHSAENTLRLWSSVRQGERRNIFPFQEQADIMFNSALVYELAVLKTQAEPLLKAIGQSEPGYTEAKRLLKFLSYFLPLNEGDIPATSILREFIGGSCFHETVPLENNSSAPDGVIRNDNNLI
ncbi:MAG: nucleoside kinase [Firmicutes bacterium]|jgi:uridine kinase|nr:nucleoside kinase [Bacillota bacterium]